MDQEMDSALQLISRDQERRVVQFWILSPETRRNSRSLLVTRVIAAGWHICFDVLERLLVGEPIGRIVGTEAMKFGGWQRLNSEYAKQFGIEKPNGPRQAAQNS
jgi:hypothetical protein